MTNEQIGELLTTIKHYCWDFDNRLKSIEKNLDNMDFNCDCDSEDYSSELNDIQSSLDNIEQSMEGLCK